MFLDDAPPAGQRAAFQQYMQNGGAWMGFHVSAFTTDPNSWSWYYNTFLGPAPSRPTPGDRPPRRCAIENRTHPSTAGLPATIQSSVSEWYSWSNDLRQNPDIDILASIDPSSFPVGTDPNQQWHSGFYPIMWTNRNYKMLYANFGHNGMNYSTNTRTVVDLRQRAAEPVADQRPALAGRRRPAPPPTTPPAVRPARSSPTAWYSRDQQEQRQVRRRPRRRHRQRHRDPAVRLQQQQRPAVPVRARPAAATCGSTTAATAPRSLDVTDVSTADNAPIQTWTYGGGNNQQWQPVAEGGGYYHLVNRNSGKCLDVPAASTADSVQLVQYTCNGTAAQSFRLTAQP